jgi:hypothetical protein
MTTTAERTGGRVGQMRLGTIVRIRDGGVEVDGGADGVRPARVACAEIAASDPAELIGATVLLFCEERAAARPVVTGLVRDRLPGRPSAEERLLEAEPERDIVVRGRRVDAQGELVLRCGKSSVTLREDGKVVVKGTRLISRASGTNAVRGGTVRIN